MLKMIESGKITAEEGMRLLAAVERDRPAGGTEARARWLRIMVREGGRQKVNVNVPLELVETLVRFIPRQVMERAGADLDVAALIEQIRAGARGRIVEIEDDDHHVHVFVE